jgi:hypothetical protein
MKKFWLTSLVILCCCCAAWAQQGHDVPDSAAGRRNLKSGLPGGGSAGSNAGGYSGGNVGGHAGGSGAVMPINFSGVVKEMNKVWLQWDVDSAEDGAYLVIERGTDGEHFETIGALRKAGNQSHYELTDLAPPNGIDFYRIKYMGQGGWVSYSKTLQLSLSGDVDFRFYPNPVDKLFIIRTEHMIDIQVVDAGGAVRLSKRLQPGIQVINISSLERWVYILRVADKESNRIVSNQLLKN